jgi:thiamine kinase
MPGSAPLDLEAIARAYVPGQGPVSMERLSAGLVNETYRVTRAGVRYALRVPAADAEDLGVDRAWECRVLGYAAAAGVAPRVLRCEPSEGVLVARWIDGSTFTSEQAPDPGNIRAVALLARRVHGLPIPEAPRRMTPASWVGHYRQALARRAPGGRSCGLEPELSARLAALAALPGVPVVLCHSDLHAANLVVAAAGLVLLDWEYAHVSEPFWDLAGWSCNNDLGAAERRLLLSSYVGRAPSDQEQVRLGHLAWLFDYVCLLWSKLFAARAGVQEQGIVARAEVLLERLKSSSLVVEAGNFRHTNGP